jgi:hypothetical protein
MAARVLPAYMRIKEVNKQMEAEVKTTALTLNYCYFDINTECELGLETPDSKLCAKCVATAFDDIVRM